MKTILALTLLAVFRGASAQNAYVAFPAHGSSVTRGTNITVQVTKPNSLTGSISVALALGLRSCEPSTTAWSPSCQSIPSDGVFGDVLYSGSFNPVYHEPALPPYQNFTGLCRGECGFECGAFFAAWGWSGGDFGRVEHDR